MQKFNPKMARTLVKGAVLSVAIAASLTAIREVARRAGIADNPSNAKATALIQQDLFFGRNMPGGTQVSQEQFRAFVEKAIRLTPRFANAPRFPGRLTVSDTDGQYKDSKNRIIQEPSEVVTLFVEDTPESKTAINQIVAAYLRQFNQESVLQLANKDELKVGFGAGENLIDNDQIPEVIEIDLFFGRNLPGGGQISQQQFQAFVEREMISRFPTGLTIFDTNRQFRNSTFKVVKLLLLDTVENETAIDEIIKAYTKQFTQESVLLAVNEKVAIGFGTGENLIDNDRTPKLIQVDLFLGGNIRDRGQVSPQQFQAFVDKVITPRFPNGLTIFQANRQFKDSTDNTIKEPCKVVRLILEDTVKNETAIDEIIKAYQQQFEQASVLLVVDEDVVVTFDAQLPTAATP